MGLTRAFLIRSLFGHLEPGHHFGNWLLLRTADASYPVAIAVVVAAAVACSLLLTRLLTLLTESKVVAFLGVVLFAFSTAAAPSLLWWSAALNALPRTLAGVLFLDSALRWWQRRRVAYFLLAVTSLSVGTLFYEKVTYLPVVAALIILGWFSVGGIWHRVATLVTRDWPLGVGVLIPLAVYWSVYLHLGYSREITVHPSRDEIVKYIGYAFFEGVVPSLFGLATIYHRVGSFTTSALLGMIFLLFLIVVTVARRRFAWKGWRLLAVVFVANAAQVGLARAGLVGPLYGRETKYLSDYVWLVAVCGVLIWSGGRHGRD